jgi:transcriptional regulator with XRE-family HTH domain
VSMDQEKNIHSAMTRARMRAGLTQAELADLMCTTQSTIARLESGGRYPNLTTLEKLAEVTGHRLEVRFIRDVN